MKGFIQQVQNRQITTVSCDRCVRSYERVAPSAAKSQFYYSFARSIRTILRKGSSSTNEIAILLQFRAIDTHDPTKGYYMQSTSPVYYSVLQSTTPAPAPPRPAPAAPAPPVAAKCPFYSSFARSTCRIL